MAEVEASSLRAAMVIAERRHSRQPMVDAECAGVVRLAATLSSTVLHQP
jgi:hypothetical protein